MKKSRIWVALGTYVMAYSVGCSATRPSLSGPSSANANMGSNSNNNASSTCTLSPNLTAYTNLTYASDSSTQMLDIIIPPASAPAEGYSLVVRIHGGGFEGGDKQGEECDEMADAIYNSNWALASLNYRLSQEALFPAGLQDVRAAIRWLRANASTYHLNGNKIAVWGESAGGYLASAIGVLGDQSITTVIATANATSSAETSNAGVSSAVLAVVDFFGPINFTKMDAELTANPPSSCPVVCPNTTSSSSTSLDTNCWQSHDATNSPESTWLGVVVSDTNNVSVEASILTNYIAGNPNLPFFFLRHGSDDCQIPYKQDADLTASIANSNLYNAEVLAGYEHGDPRFSTDGVTLPAAIATLANYL